MSPALPGGSPAATRGPNTRHVARTRGTWRHVWAPCVGRPSDDLTFTAPATPAGRLAGRANPCLLLPEPASLTRALAALAPAAPRGAATQSNFIVAESSPTGYGRKAAECLSVMEIASFPCGIYDSATLRRSPSLVPIYTPRYTASRLLENSVKCASASF